MESKEVKDETEIKNQVSYRQRALQERLDRERDCGRGADGANERSQELAAIVQLRAEQAEQAAEGNAHA
jgi:hypothetical protein